MCIQGECRLSTLIAAIDDRLLTVHQHYFYNLVPPSEVALYACPPNEDPRLYAQAVASNPDPSCLVPALATGVEDLEKRLQTQHETTTQHQSKLAEINSKISNLDREHNLKNTVKVAELKRRYMVICARVIRLMRCLWVLKRLGCGTSEAEVVVKNKSVFLDSYKWRKLSSEN